MVGRVDDVLFLENTIGRDGGGGMGVGAQCR